MKYSKAILCILFISAAQIAYGAEEEAKKSTQYQRYEHGVIGTPADAEERMVLDLEKEREVTSGGKNLYHVQGTDEFLGKEMDDIKDRISGIESKVNSIEKEISKLRDDLKRGKK